LHLLAFAGICLHLLAMLTFACICLHLVRNGTPGVNKLSN
jgi:hypothetical protein